MVYHGYENGMRTLGRQTLLEPSNGPLTAGSVPRVATFHSPCASRGRQAKRIGAGPIG
jgi:hypothetical protein